MKTSGDIVRTSWDEACRRALDEVVQYANYVAAPSLDRLDEINDSLAAFVRDPMRFDAKYVVDLMEYAAAISIHTILDSGQCWNTEQMWLLLCKKQSDYGHGNINNFGLAGVAVRLCDKIARAKNLEARGGVFSVSNETLLDTYEDIVGYATIAVMLRDDTFKYHLENAAEVYASTERIPYTEEREISQ